ncbi:NAD(P)-dependent oxidoreductase [Streptomyces sp. TRM76323]|uniref:NAD(P)-dependent oxidoreductase n=1 Tax=Streptomyces tamarix TaxID=3078565 RepID=A0ABU3QE85_9ACTN|nr:NAD(P)-dependent oxidoreductase [Streptomyces tamarix]MDT9680659.1 NAD(P)-dependent oxidoreductase [Streptomyces tamarix]
MTGTSVVVLGATGFLGRHLCDAFRSAGARVTGVSRGHPGSFAPPSVRRWEHLDPLREPPARLARLLDEVAADTVVNAAGQVWGVTPEQQEAANADLVGRLLDAVAAAPRRPRLVQLGTVHEYGPGTAGRPFAEDHPTAPDTAYGRTKLRATRAVLDAAGTSGVDGVVLRISNVCGAGAPTGSLLGSLAARLAAHRGPGPMEWDLAPATARRDFVDAGDVADAVVACARAPRARVAGRVVNVGSGRAVVVQDVVDRLVELSGVPVRRSAAARPEPGAGPGGSASSAAAWQALDITLARRALEWRPRRDLDDSLRALLAAV